MKDINEIRATLPMLDQTEQETAEVIPFDEVRRRVKLLDLKRQIARGEYKPDLSRLAAAMLRHDDFHIKA